MTARDPQLAAAVADLGALPMPVGAVRPMCDVAVPLTQLQSDLRRLLARQRVQASVERLGWLIAHPEAAATAQPAPAGVLAEYRHLLYDADDDATTKPFPYPTLPEEGS